MKCCGKRHPHKNQNESPESVKGKESGPESFKAQMFHQLLRNNELLKMRWDEAQKL